ncbi:hypothetical protein B6U67_05645 [Methanosarcinales archaeon ex4484_138]|nr:MAG: hypothetical protein B6U67_05645 [Methanosarcinales archaeon ex4484_138]
MGYGQYQLEEKYLDNLNRIDNQLVTIVQNNDQENFQKTYPIDNQLVTIVQNNDQENFQKTYPKLIQYVQKHGTPLPDDEIHESQIIIPPDDLTLEEAKKIFTGEGILED